MVRVAARAWMTRRRRPGRVTRHGSPPVARGPPVAPRPAGCPILTREPAIGAVRIGPNVVRTPGAATATVGAMRYPEAPRLDLVEDLHGHRVADPYRWLEDAADPRTEAWTRGPGRPHRRGARRPCRCARSSPPGWRSWCTRAPSACRSGGAGGRSPPAATPARSTPSCGSARPTARVRVLVDPMALDPAGTTTLDAWSPSWEGDRLAYQLSTGGDEESRLYVLDVATGEVIDGPVDRCRYSPVAWLPGGEELFYVRRLAPDQVPAGEEQFHRRVWRHRVGTPADDDVLVHGEGSDPTTYFGVHTSRDGRWLVVSGSAGTAPARRRLDRRPRRRRRPARVPGRRRRADRRLGGPRRPALADVRPRHPALAARRRRPGGPGDLGAGGLAGRRPAAAGRRALRRRARRRPGRRPAGARRARRRRHRPAVGVGRRTAPAGSADVDGPGRRQHLRGQLAAGGRQRGLGRLHRLRHAAVGAALGRRLADGAAELGAGRRRRRRARR